MMLLLGNRLKKSNLFTRLSLLEGIRRLEVAMASCPTITGFPYETLTHEQVAKFHFEPCIQNINVSSTQGKTQTHITHNTSLIPAGSKKMVSLNGLNQRIVYAVFLQEKSGMLTREGCLVVLVFHGMRVPDCSKTIHHHIMQYLH